MSEPVPTVSVVIPCHNLGAYLDEAVQSVLDQTYRDFEIIVIDDGSTDLATRHLFTSYARPHTRILRTPNQGLARTRNLGLAEARGRYVSCLDADDLLEPTFLERAVAVLDGDAGIAFASMWLRGFGELEFDWNPTSCDFPDLLLEDSVCTAALTRKEAMTAIGGYDPAMPVSGYEDWDLAIGLVERGLRGVIMPEYLFRYRIRWRESMTTSCTAPGNHAALMDYIVRKHADSYRRHMPQLLVALERKCIEMERHPTSQPGRDEEAERRADVASASLQAVLSSTTWRATRPLRRALDAIKNVGGGVPVSPRTPRLSIVLTCRDQGIDLTSTLESLHGRSATDEVIVVDHGSTDPLTLSILDGLQTGGVRVVRAGPASVIEARAEGLRAARGRFLLAVGPEQTLDAELIPSSIEALGGEGDCAFVIAGLRDRELSDCTWSLAQATVGDLAGRSRYPFPLVRRDAFEAVGGYDTTAPSTELADADLVLRLAAQGYRTATVDAVVTHHRRRRRVAGPDALPFPPVLAELLERHPDFYRQHALEAFLGHENRRRQLQAVVVDPRLPWKEDVADPTWGKLRRLGPVSSVWGIDRGLPVDRHYIAAFLDRFRSDIRGRVLEVKDANYTRGYGHDLEAIDVLDVVADNPDATIVADLGIPGSLPEATFDCFLLTQTLHFVYPLREALRNAYRALKPGGVLLATLPCVSRVDYESGVEGDFWRVTAASARRLFEESFPEGEVEVFSHGNVLTCCAFLMGLAAEELTTEELDHQDPYFPLIVCVRAIKRGRVSEPVSGTAVCGGGPHTVRGDADARSPEPRGAILLYHSIGRREADRWGLAVSPERFEEQMARLSQRFEPTSLAQLAAQVVARRVRPGAVAVTFDDGYRDNLLVALPVLRRWAVPATIFVSGEEAGHDATFWWEELDARATAAAMDDASFRELHGRLTAAGPDERRMALDELPPPTATPPARLGSDDLRRLAADPLVSIGGHGWSHRRLDALPEEEQELDIRNNLETLELVTRVRVRLFAYPFGAPATETTIRLLREAGISAACAVRDAAVTDASDLMDLPRIEVGDWSGDKLGERLQELFTA